MSRSSCVLTPANYASGTACRLTVVPVSDVDGEDESGTITASASGVWSGIASVTVIDTTPLPALLIGPDLALTEGGAAGTMRITLDAEPPSNVTVRINLSSSLVGKASISTTSCTLTPSNHASATACPVLVTPLPDTDTDDEGGTVTASASGLSSVSARVTVIDDDTQQIHLTPNPATVNEGGAPITLSATLEHPPSSTVSISFVQGSLAATSAIVDTSVTCALTASNYNSQTACTTTVTPVDDANTTNETGNVGARSTGIPSGISAVTVIDAGSPPPPIDHRGESIIHQLCQRAARTASVCGCRAALAPPYR